MPLLIWEFLVKNNLLPYIAIALLSWLSWGLWGSNVELRKEAAQAKEAVQFANEAMGIIQAHNEQRLNELEEARNRTWKAGKHEAAF
jgi:hypothetical protein